MNVSIGDLMESLPLERCCKLYQLVGHRYTDVKTSSLMYVLTDNVSQRNLVSLQ